MKELLEDGYIACWLFSLSFAVGSWMLLVSRLRVDAWHGYFAPVHVIGGHVMHVFGVVIMAVFCYSATERLTEKVTHLERQHSDWVQRSQPVNSMPIAIPQSIKADDGRPYLTLKTSSGTVYEWSEDDGGTTRTMRSAH